MRDFRKEHHITHGPAMQNLMRVSAWTEIHRPLGERIMEVLEAWEGVEEVPFNLQEEGLLSEGGRIFIRTVAEVYSRVYETERKFILESDMEGGRFFYLDGGRIKTLATSWRHGDVLPVCGAAQRITLEIEDALGTGPDAYDALFSLSRALSAQLFRICREEAPQSRRKGRVDEACKILGGRRLF